MEGSLPTHGTGEDGVLPRNCRLKMEESKETTRDPYGTIPFRVVAPVAVLDQWRAECEDVFWYLGRVVYHGPDRKLEGNPSVVLTSYDTLRQLKHWAPDLGRWARKAFDEADMLRNMGRTAPKMCMAALALDAPAMEHHGHSGEQFKERFGGLRNAY